MSSPQLFKPRANSITVLILLSFALGVVGLAALSYALWFSSYATRVNMSAIQPVPFSHKHHVKGVGLDCRYCHTTVERSAFAGMPSTHTCMTCHSQIWSKSKELAPVRRSFETENPIGWNRIQRLPDFVFFNHSIHIAKGLSCETCHGQVQEIVFMQKKRAFYMRECLACHRTHTAASAQLTSCSTCHH